MNLWNIPLICLIVNDIFLSALRLNNYVTNYRLAKVRISRGVESDPLSWPLSNFNSNKSWPSIQVRFRSFGQKFDFIATKSKEYDQTTVENFGYTELKVSDWKPEFYEAQSDSRNIVSALGYLQDNIFVGFATIGNITYFLEPPYLYFPNYGKNSSVIVYRNLDVLHPMNETINPRLFSRIENIPSSSPSRFFKRSENPSKSNELVCKIEIVGDHTLFWLMQNNTEMTKQLLYLHVKFADRIFRTTNFGLPTVRIVPQKVVVYTDPQILISADSPSTAAFFLRQFSLRPQNACLSMCICDQRFDNDVIGYSYSASLSNDSGGICQTNDVNFHENRNTGVITLRSPNNEKIPLAMSLQMFTHEVGHAFGSDSDPPSSFLCSPGGDHGYYIMNPRPQSKITFISKQFSPCSIKNMSHIIQKNGNCMKTTAPMVCGNSIREGKEDCDCGDSESVCKSIDPCCTPKGGIGNDSECTFRRSLGDECSPSENLCCETNCRITLKSRQCFFDPERCLTSFCDGKSKDCPVPTPSPDGTPCMFSSRTCSRGSCNSTVCLDNKLKDCICSVEELACHVCCRNFDQNCLPAWVFGFFTPDGDKHKLKPDTPCGYNQELTRCDMSGKCSSFPRSHEEKTLVLWIVLIVICCGLILLAIGIIIGIQIAAKWTTRSAVLLEPV